jgi:hypothetical protein
MRKESKTWQVLSLHVMLVVSLREKLLCILTEHLHLLPLQSFGNLLQCYVMISAEIIPESAYPSVNEVAREQPGTRITVIFPGPMNVRNAVIHFIIHFQHY